MFLVSVYIQRVLVLFDKVIVVRFLNTKLVFSLNFVTSPTAFKVYKRTLYQRISRSNALAIQSYPLRYRHISRPLGAAQLLEKRYIISIYALLLSYFVYTLVRRRTSLGQIEVAPTILVDSLRQSEAIQLDSILSYQLGSREYTLSEGSS